MCLKCNSETLCRVCCLWSYCGRGKWTLQKVQRIWDDIDSNRDDGTLKDLHQIQRHSADVDLARKCCVMCSPFFLAISTFLAFVAFVALGANADCNPAHQPPPTLASPIQGDFLSKHTSAADCECELGVGWRGIWEIWRIALKPASFPESPPGSSFQAH